MIFALAVPSSENVLLPSHMTTGQSLALDERPPGMQLLLTIMIETVISAVDLFVISVPQTYFLHPGQLAVQSRLSWMMLPHPCADLQYAHLYVYCACRSSRRRTRRQWQPPLRLLKSQL